MSIFWKVNRHTIPAINTLYFLFYARMQMTFFRDVRGDSDAEEPTVAAVVGPPAEGCVRGRNLCCGMLYEPPEQGAGQSKLTIVMHTDVCGTGTGKWLANRKVLAQLVQTWRDLKAHVASFEHAPEGKR